MADISKITALDGTTYDIKDITARRVHEYLALESRTYENVIATSNDNVGGGFFYLRVRPTSFNQKWHVKTRVHATVPGYPNYDTETIFDIWGFDNTYSWYACLNRIKSTSYRPIYYNSVFFTNQTGYNNDCGHWIGFNLYYATNNLNASYKRTVVADLLFYDGCTVEMQDSLITSTNIPNRASHTNWYSSTDTSFTNLDACSYGLKQSGDANTTNISNILNNGGVYVADSTVTRYQLMFEKDENTLTPLNNDSNVVGTTKTMLTNVEFNPFGRIYYYSSTTIISASGNIGAGSTYWAYYGIDLRYTFNCAQTLTANKPLYLVVTPTSNGKCKIASTTPWAQTIPSTNDGNWYILIGRTYSTYQMTLFPVHPVYKYDGTKVVRVVPVSNSGSKPVTIQLDTVTNTSGSYSHTTTNTNVTADMKPIRIECSDPSIFRSDITVTTSDGSITLACSEVAGTSSVSVVLMKELQPGESGSEFDVLSGRIGALSQLETTNKTNLVSAVNEVNAKIYNFVTETNINSVNITVKQASMHFLIIQSNAASAKYVGFVYSGSAEATFTDIYKGTNVTMTSSQVSGNNVITYGVGSTARKLYIIDILMYGDPIVSIV